MGRRSDGGRESGGVWEGGGQGRGSLMEDLCQKLCASALRSLGVYRAHVCHTHVHALYTSMYMYVGICVYVILVCVTHLCHTHILHAGEIVIAKCA